MSKTTVILTVLLAFSLILNFVFLTNFESHLTSLESEILSVNKNQQRLIEDINRNEEKITELESQLIALKTWIEEGWIYERDFEHGNESIVLRWQEEYRYIIIEIKCWVDLNGTYGFQPIAVVRMVPLNSESEPEGYNWVGAPFMLDNQYGYKFVAPEEMYGKRFLFWQSEKTFMIIPNRTLILELGFGPDCWWMNYG